MMILCVFVCMCVCVREKEREGEGDSGCCDICLRVTVTLCEILLNA